MAKKRQPSETPSLQPDNRGLVDFEVTVYSSVGEAGSVGVRSPSGPSALVASNFRPPVPIELA